MDNQTYIQPTEDELKTVQRFVDFAMKRHNNLIRMNKELPNDPLDQELSTLRMRLIATMEYSRDKMLDLFEDYKTGRVPVPFQVKINQK